jgi:ribosomal subunit interface protein
VRTPTGKEAAVDMVVKGKGDRVPVRTRDRVERKLQRLARLDARLHRIEVQVAREPSPRGDGGHHLHASARSARRTFRASATGTDFDIALDRLVQRLERQITEDQGKRRTRMLNGANRLKSRRTSPRLEGEASGTPLEGEQG